ncbi:MAG: hypothetical protein KJ050_16520 [Candidatus Omnitrophica bacterium]|nr:MAG: hypothetical protein UZ16_OP3001002888 [Candidatus Hinthialibacteria bacterium OLB16]MCC6733903.1 hypothetical protein [Candidatus Omnitrophota bacterium]MCE7909173.1 hypothetical protein [Candidatus Omnitrophica bacterium COP1]MCK6497241.1 hypothetical protein [bacterium]MCL4736530.1 hypothetical protein [Candidatus Omnitrophota bacterium]
MADVKTLRMALKKVEDQLHHQGMWKLPDRTPPQIFIDERWDPKTREVADVLNEVFLIRSMPVCVKMFGPVRDSTVQAFKYDYVTPIDRMEYARSQLNRLIADLGMLPRIDRTQLMKVEG